MAVTNVAAQGGAPHHSPLGRSPPIEVSWSWENGASRIAVTLRAASLLGRPTTDSLGALFFGRERLPAESGSSVSVMHLTEADAGPGEAQKAEHVALSSFPFSSVHPHMGVTG
jgi:hypothetical protein